MLCFVLQGTNGPRAPSSPYPSPASGNAMKGGGARPVAGAGMNASLSGGGGGGGGGGGTAYRTGGGVTWGGTQPPYTANAAQIRYNSMPANSMPPYPSTQPYNSQPASVSSSLYT